MNRTTSRSMLDHTAHASLARADATRTAVVEARRAWTIQTPPRDPDPIRDREARGHRPFAGGRRHHWNAPIRLTRRVAASGRGPCASMKREILINATPRETRVAILEDDQLVELLVDRPDARRMVGDIYLGKVEAVLPGIQAAFVDIGTEKSAFLHASDLVIATRSRRTTRTTTTTTPTATTSGDEAAATPRESARRSRTSLKRGQEILVQVSKEPISTKGPRVTAQISLAGRFLVYMPFASRVGVSRKIGDRAERQRLREHGAGDPARRRPAASSCAPSARTSTQETFERELDDADHSGSGSRRRRTSRAPRRSSTARRA